MEVENEFSFSRANAKIQITPQNTEASFGPIPDFVPVDNMEIIEVNQGKNGGVTSFFKFSRQNQRIYYHVLKKKSVLGVRQHVFEILII